MPYLTSLDKLKIVVSKPKKIVSFSHTDLNEIQVAVRQPNRHWKTHTEVIKYTQEALRLNEATKAITAKFDEIGGERSPLGRPVGGAVVQRGGEYFRDYEGGNIVFASGGSTTATATATIQISILYKGIHCFGKSEASDEPYAVVGAYALRGLDRTMTKKFPIGSDSYENFVASTDATDSVLVSPDVDSWSPQTVVIISTIMEHDSGDADRVAASIEQKIKDAADTAGYGEEVSQFTGILDSLGIPGIIAALLGVGDDHIGTVVDTIDYNQIVPKRSMQTFQNISYNFESKLISDGDASYKLYYEVYAEQVPPRILL